MKRTHLSIRWRLVIDLPVIMCVLVCSWQAAHNSTSALRPHVAGRCNRDVSLWGHDEFIKVDQSEEEAPAELIMPHLCLMPVPAISTSHDPDVMVHWQLEHLNLNPLWKCWSDFNLFSTDVIDSRMWSSLLQPPFIIMMRSLWGSYVCSQCLSMCLLRKPVEL